MNDTNVRRELVELLEGRGAHMSFEEAVADFPDDAINRRPPNVDYTPFALVEHLRLTQADILEYVIERDYRDKSWPDDYWPASDKEATREEFDAAVRGFVADRDALRGLVLDRSTDPFAVIPGSPGHTLAREVRIAGDHCAYHVGEFAILRQVMGTWPSEHGPD
jgi:DinB family protein